MKRNIFVGNLAWATDDNSLIDHFQQCGDVVRAKVMTDLHTGKSRGFAFVTMASDEQHEDAIHTLNNSNLDGRNIVVAEAKEKPVRENRENRENSRDGGYRRTEGSNRRYDDDRGNRRYNDRNDRRY